MVERLKAIGVNEIACLLDLGVATDTVLESLYALNEVRQRSNSSTDTEVDYSIAAQLRLARSTHLQCTPGMARMLVADPASLEALRPLQKLVLGGEALPSAVAQSLAPVMAGDIINVYRPTETTVWSTAGAPGQSRRSNHYRATHRQHAALHRGSTAPPGAHRCPRGTVDRRCGGDAGLSQSS